MERIKRKLYRNFMLASLGATKMFSRADYNIPIKWYSIYDSLRVSSEVVHTRLQLVDEDIQEEWEEKEQRLERSLGDRPFYDRDEIQELQNKIDDIRLET